MREIRIVYCEICDNLVFPDELIMEKGWCSRCKKDTRRIAILRINDDGVSAK